MSNWFHDWFEDWDCDCYCYPVYDPENDEWGFKCGCNCTF